MVRPRAARHSPINLTSTSQDGLGALAALAEVAALASSERLPLVSLNTNTPGFACAVNGAPKRPATPTPLDEAPSKRPTVLNFDLSDSPPPRVPLKRGRGRPPKSDATSASHSIVATPAPRAKGKKKTKPEDGSEANRKHWGVHETTILLEAVLGMDADDIFGKLTVQSNLIWPKHEFTQPLKVIALLPVDFNRTAAQCKARFESLLSTFKALYGFRTFTGGGADADEYDWDNEQAVDAHLANSKAQGCDVDGLNAQVCKMWKENGWYDLFVHRYKDNPKVVRQTPRSSAEISDDEDAGFRFHDDNDDDLKPSKPLSTAKPLPDVKPTSSRTATAKPTSHVGSSKPPSSRTDKHKIKKEDRLSGLNTWLTTKARNDERMAELRARDGEFKRLREAADVAKTILNDDTGVYSFTNRDKANEVMARFLDHALGI
ncbi:hypothetical protein GGX14DRAFT_391283 [Mycena pura]|uniref:Uncharacterized protein n=1 Tax=Mycena pura TaxID=153505 RepID=A0AAD6YF79_9AGAR|nr:hypothetical protein GGX14DRAFT_391283 [Mycena pura]